MPIQAQVTLDTSGRMLLGTDIARRRDHPLQPARGHDRPQLLDRPGAHARAGALAHREHPAADLDHPQRRAAAQRRRQGRLSDGAGPAGHGARRVRRRVRRQRRRRLLRHDAGAHRRIVAHLDALDPAALRRPQERLDQIRSARHAAHAAARRLGRARDLAARRIPRRCWWASASTRRAAARSSRRCWPTTTTRCSQVAREQVEGGAHVLDVCVALTERADEAEQMRQVGQEAGDGHRGAAGDRLDRGERDPGRAGDLSGPRDHQLDQPGERARASVDSVLPLAREHGSAVVALTIDEEGMAKTAERKVAVAKRIHEIATERVWAARRGAALRRADLPGHDGAGGAARQRACRRWRASAASRRSCPAC